jgi:hypothetical protein
VHVWRRSYDVPPPGGESLKDTGARVWPYYIHTIQPQVLKGRTVLVTAHGNSLRALIMALDGLTPDEVVAMELATGVPGDLPAERTIRRSSRRPFSRPDRFGLRCRSGHRKPSVYPGPATLRICKLADTRPTFFLCKEHRRLSSDIAFNCDSLAARPEHDDVLPPLSIE